MTQDGTATTWRRVLIPGDGKWPGRVALVAYDEWGDPVVSYPCAWYRTREMAEADVAEGEKAER